MNILTRPLLVLLRLVIGWHILFEGLDKLSKADWTNEPYLRELARGPRANEEKLRELKKSSFSSDPYLREASGPLANFFHWIDGDPLIERLTPTADGKFPPALDRDWTAYFNRFVAHYNLDPKQKDWAEANFKQSRETTLRWLLSGTKLVKKPAPAGNAASEIEMTTQQRVELYKELLRKARENQREVAPVDRNPLEAKAKEEADKLRNELRKELDQQTVNFYTHLHELFANDPGPPRCGYLWLFSGTPSVGVLNVLTYDVRNRETLPAARDLLANDPEPPRCGYIWLFSGTPTAAVLNVLTYDVRNRETLPATARAVDWMPAPVTPPWKGWTWEQWQPYVIWGSVAVIGAVLILSVLSLLLGALWRSHPVALLLFLGVIVLGAAGFAWWSWSEGTLQQWYEELLSRRLEYTDLVTKWSLTIIGGCLLLGVFTRTACVAGAAFLLLFFAAMPPLPGFPEPPRAEGHYVYINKNIIEMVALLALATTRSGRWLGLDGLLQFFSVRRWRRTEPEDRSSETPRSAGPPSVRKETQPREAITS
jgi:uncharacterized membrane protein YphA (DoxX/SURF4 family)